MLEVSKLLQKLLCGASFRHLEGVGGEEIPMNKRLNFARGSSDTAVKTILKFISTIILRWCLSNPCWNFCYGVIIMLQNLARSARARASGYHPPPLQSQDAALVTAYETMFGKLTLVFGDITTWVDDQYVCFVKDLRIFQKNSG